MKFMGIYLIGYVIFMGGVIAALWKMRVLERVGPVWTTIGIVIAIGLGVMISVSGSGKKETIEIDKS